MILQSARIVMTPLVNLVSKRIGDETNIKDNSRGCNSVEKAEAWLDDW